MPVSIGVRVEMATFEQSAGSSHEEEGLDTPRDRASLRGDSMVAYPFEGGIEYRSLDLEEVMS